MSGKHKRKRRWALARKYQSAHIRALVGFEKVTGLTLPPGTLPGTVLVDGTAFDELSLPTWTTLVAVTDIVRDICNTLAMCHDSAVRQLGEQLSTESADAWSGSPISVRHKWMDRVPLQRWDGDHKRALRVFDAAVKVLEATDPTEPSREALRFPYLQQLRVDLFDTLERAKVPLLAYTTEMRREEGIRRLQSAT